MNENDVLVLDFLRFGGPVYSGRDRGELARKEALIESPENANKTILSRIPENTYTVTTSFLLGMFGKSIKEAGSREDFLAKFQFEMPSAFEPTLDSCIERALRDQTSLL